ncbi:cytochrome P450 [Phenylobacterium sp.]|uniref:cytochrome P450 n=1 Tax=Phenylobacterium sp. TaxID=1871053 RepID=UPI002E32A1DB|nr:cytochrome P450 [Phenylobacterium sp.]HEX3364636.1 cytochrome P450 [Phenylobacterium sp.]
MVDFDLYEKRRGLVPAQDWWLELRDGQSSPLAWTPRNGGHWIALRGAAIKEVLSDSDRFSSRYINVPRIDHSAHSTPAPLPISLDPPLHGPYRAILNPLVAPGPVRDKEDLIRSVAAGFLDGFKDAGRCEFMSAFARRIPAAVVLAMADLPLSDAATISDLSSGVTRPKHPNDSTESLQGLVDYFRPVSDTRRGGSGRDVISRIVNGQVNGDRLGEDDAVGMVLQFVGAGLDTTGSIMGYAMFYLARHPDQQHRLVENPELIPRAAEELVRRFPIASVGREVRQDISFHGFNLKTEDMILAPTALINLDEALFPNPVEVDFDRPSALNNTFGEGQHRCPGGILARTEVRIALQEWLKRIPQFELAADAVDFENGIVANMDALPLKWSH